MASTAVVSKSEHDELCCAYASLILQDAAADVTPDNISKLISASGNTVESYWPGLFSKVVNSVKLGDLLKNVGGGGAVAAGPVAAVAATEAAAPAEAEKEPQEEAADVNVGDIFAQDDDY
uniref:60S acidic ribosomal protein P1 n=1 Tax=Euplotes harpa TaxID=151035 RepID=A0A7S3N756_9SPIT